MDLLPSQYVDQGFKWKCKITSNKQTNKQKRTKIGRKETKEKETGEIKN